MKESDQTSFDHAQATLVKNDIPKERIELIKAMSTEMILSPLKERSVDVVICNPPFYASRQELEEGMKIKAVGPHAVSVCAVLFAYKRRRQRQATSLSHEAERWLSSDR